MYFYIFRPRRARGELEPTPSDAALAPRDIGRYGHPRGVFMTRPPPPKCYGCVVRWQTSGGRAKCAPRMYFDIFRPRHGELESTPSGAMWLPETSAGTATHAAYL
jgi:hypothetical protein